MPFILTNIELSTLFWETLEISLEIMGLVIVMMIIVEVLELKFSRVIHRLITKNKFFQYFFSSLMGIIPGCSGTFFIDSLYMADVVGVGGIISVMIWPFSSGQ